MDNKLSLDVVASKIIVIRGKRVMLDRDLAELYGVSTKRLNQAVKRNMERFPEDFMFPLTEKEKKEVVTNCDHLSALKFSYQSPLAFTEQGVAMLSSVLNSEQAIRVNIQIMRTFTYLRRMFLTNADLRRKIELMEKKYDKQFAVVFQIFKELIEPASKVSQPKRQIGFHKD
ncbi:MAG: ORF6N domain-containing protein [Candidatus Omnitrophica bacterium]|nr:ORF6N domain-containing protein [Candidatus Omnitrophota bacterium]